MDQRRSESLTRFLMRRAMRKAKNPDPPAKYIPLFHPVRWKFSVGNGSLSVRVGLFGLYLYWHAIVPVPDNISVDAETTGVVIFFMPLGLLPGSLVPCKRWVKLRNFREAA
jgi:hypothetical protein